MKQLITADQIHEAVSAMGRRISDDYRGRPLSVVGVLTGSILLVSDLIRRIDVPLRLVLVQASSYRGATTQPGELRLDGSLLSELRGRDVLIVDDIFDTGRTLAAVSECIRNEGASSVRAAVLLWKERPRKVEVQPDYCAFRIPDVFVVGYGLDYNGEHRCLPYIAALEENDTLPAGSCAGPVPAVGGHG